MVIGRSGTGIDELKADLEKMTGKTLSSSSIKEGKKKQNWTHSSQLRASHRLSKEEFPPEEP